MSLFQVLFCADLKKFQSLKQMMQPKKEEGEDREEEEIAVCKKPKKAEHSGTVKTLKPKSAKMSVKKKKVV